MKLGFSYTNNLIFKRNLPLLLSLSVLCFISAILVYFNYQNYISNTSKIKVLEQEAAALDQKKSLIDFKNQVIDTEFDLDTANLALSQLIPTKEDYFSILLALERISAKTTFIITSYNINVDTSTVNRLAILIEGQGDPNSFLEFLKEYNFAGGRLITIDQIDFSQEAFSDTKINLNVYSGPVSTTHSSNSESVDVKLIGQILDKVQIDLKPEIEVSTDYPTKTNPF